MNGLEIEIEGTRSRRLEKTTMNGEFSRQAVPQQRLVNLPGFPENKAGFMKTPYETVGVGIRELRAGGWFIDYSSH